MFVMDSSVLLRRPMILLWKKPNDSVLNEHSAAVEIHDYTEAVYVA